MQQTGLCSENSIEGSIKNHPEDFVVEEISLYEPCGSGEHVYLSVRKTNLSHDALLNLVARALNVSIRAIGYAGRKDLYATTTQMLSAHLPGFDVEYQTILATLSCCGNRGTQTNSALAIFSGIDSKSKFVMWMKKV